MKPQVTFESIDCNHMTSRFEILTARTRAEEEKVHIYKSVSLDLIMAATVVTRDILHPLGGVKCRELLRLP